MNPELMPHSSFDLQVIRGSCKENVAVYQISLVALYQRIPTGNVALKQRHKTAEVTTNGTKIG